MIDVNVRGTASMIDAHYDLLRKSELRHVLSVSPPLHTLSRDWLAPHPAYTTSKYAMTALTLGVAHELRANTLWPRKLLSTAATKMLEARTGIPGYSLGLPPRVFAKAVHRVLCSDVTALSRLDEEVDEEYDNEGVDDIFISLLRPS